MTYVTDTHVPTYSPLGFSAGVAIVKQWFAVSCERRRLRTMTYSQLNDIGMTVADARREAAKPFWVSKPR